MNPSASAITFHSKEFTRMNPSMFFFSKVNEDPYDSSRRFIRFHNIWGKFK